MYVFELFVFKIKVVNLKWKLYIKDIEIFFIIIKDYLSFNNIFFLMRI